MQTVSFEWNINPFFQEKKTKDGISKCILLKILPSMVSVKVVQRNLDKSDILVSKVGPVLLFPH